MHPTPTEQLQAVRHLIERAGSSPELPTESAQLLNEATRLLRRLERSWPKRMPFLLDDNRRALRLLAELRPHLPSLTDEISAAGASPSAEGEEAATDLNLVLRDLLARAVHVLPDDAEGDEARVRIAEHQRHRIAADPSLNRHPTA